tara:strand:+ start:412 stop:2052 length:1641 start_codon:yes stop_codon:yes gene_type:complete
MAYYFLFPEKDTTLYSHPDRTKVNTGQDEILEIVKEKGSTNDLYYPSRVLIKFNNNEIQSLIKDKITYTTFNTKATCSLQLLSTEHKNLAKTLNIEAYAASQSWDEGKGRWSNLPTSSDGCSWLYRDNGTARTAWTTSSRTTEGLTMGSSSIYINEAPSGSQVKLTINGIDFIPVLSSSLFTNSPTENYVDLYISGSGTLNTGSLNSTESINILGQNLRDAINASSSLTLVSASYITSSYLSASVLIGTANQRTLILSGSHSGSEYNVTVTTGSITGNNQNIFTSSVANFNLQGGTDRTISSFAVGTTGSINASGIDKGGGTWYTGSDFKAVQQFINASNLDTNLDVTSIVKKHYLSINDSSTYPTGIPNNGFIIKSPDVLERNTSNSFGEMKYFSVDTHTIYPPRLVFKWDDSTHTYQSSAKNSGELSVSLYRNQKEYNQNDEATFRVHVRDKYPTRQFASSSNFLNIGYFTTASYYSVRDAYTEEEVIPFDETNTRMSADDEGMYFKIYMNGLQPERYYRVLFKHKNNEGTTVYDNNYYFKIIR